jgi:hypothetical protein
MMLRGKRCSSRLGSAQSELLSSVILVVLVLVLGLSGFLLATSWVSQRYSEDAFTSFADLCLSEFQASLISVEKRASARIAYVGVVRTGILSGDYYVGVTLYGSAIASPIWWDLVTPTSFTYNISTLDASPESLSFAQAPSYRISSQNLYIKHAGSWISLRDMDIQGQINIYSLGIMKATDMLILNISILDPSTRYLYIIIWTGFNDRYIASPILIPLTA